MANRRPQNNGRRMDFGRNNDRKSFGRSGVSPWQGGGGPGGNSGLPNLLPLSGGSTEATLALASNIINLLQPRQNPVPSLLDMPIRRDFGPDLGRFDRGFGPNRMGNQGNFRRTGNYNRAGERINTNRKQFRPNDGYRQQNKNTPKKDADSKAKPVKESAEQDPQAPTEETKQEAEDDKKDAPKTRYDDINPQYLKCHICNKSMWDGRSFQNHLVGRAHAIMMQKTAESYALTADTMRQEFKIREMKRSRKTGAIPARDFYCAMCDMYAAEGGAHRTTVGHRKLKKFLHPSCTCCHKEMPTRIELDEHRLSAEHLRNLQDKQELVSKPKPEVLLISTLNMEQSYLRSDRQRWPRERGDVKEENKDEDINKEQEEGEPNEDGKNIKQEPEEDKKEEQENVILDYKEGDDLSNVTKDMIPLYRTDRGVGKSFLTEFKCVQCVLCRKLLDGEETAAVHLRTWRHHQLFTRMLLEKAPVPQDAQESTSTVMESNKRPNDSEDNSNWKRRKTNGPDDENGMDEDSVMKEDGNSDADDLPVADELEDWEQSLDEIIQDEGQPEVTSKVEEAEEEEKAEPPEPKQEKSDEEVQITPEPITPMKKEVNTRANTPRSRGRGRPRRY